MSWLYRDLIRPVLFLQDSEKIHDRALRALGRASRSRFLTRMAAALYAAPELPVQVLGLNFPNPVGLAAGMDKMAQAAPIWPALGYGFCELGGVTWQAQPGNPTPRLFRAIDDEALVNSMGFNNDGAVAMADTLVRWKEAGLWPQHPVGINLGKSKSTPLEAAAEDYANSFRVLRPHVDFFVVNVSSPNTPNLRRLQEKSALNDILGALQQVRQTPELKVEHGAPVNSKSAPYQASYLSKPPRPVLVKVAPDLSFEALDDILELAGPRGVSGIVATNTTLARPQSRNAELTRIYASAGGLSGRPLRKRSTEVIRHLYRQTEGTLPIIGVGGIFTAADAWEKITAGASLIQVYTGMIYQGPGIAGDIVAGLRQRYASGGFTSWRQAVGSAASEKEA